MSTVARPRPGWRALDGALTTRQLGAIVAIATMALNIWLLVHFHDRFWYAPDEGNYAHVAERILDGEVLHADVQDIHPGYVNLANAAAMGVFGRELVSLRYPLVALGVIQSALVLALLAPSGIGAAAVGATAITALGLLQFLDPTANWYALFLAILLAYVMHRVPPHARLRLEAIGAIVMTAVLFRQLSGIFLAMGALTCLLLERSPEPARTDGRAWLARTLLGIMLLGLVGYLLRGTDAVGWLLFGIWPVLLLLWAIRATRMPDRRVLVIGGRMACGAAMAAAPLLAYHAVHGSLGAWYHDVIGTALSLPRMPFFERMSYARHVATAAAAIAGGDPVAVVNGAYWIVLTFLGACTGALLLRRVATREANEPGDLPVVPVIAVFYAVVSAHYQIPIYLTYSVGLSVVALLGLARGARATVGGVAVLVAIATWFHAGQPLSRGIAGTMEGRRLESVRSDSLSRMGLSVEPKDVELYAQLVAIIHREVPPGSPILAIPSHAELYFLADRPNPFRFFNTALGVRTPAQLAAVLDSLERHPPRLVIDEPRDKYHTAESRAIMAHVKARYVKLASVGPMDVYRIP